MSDQYKELYHSFEWLIPEHFNIAEACCHRWAANAHEVKQSALFFEDQVGQLTMYSYRQLSERVNQLANGLVRMGVEPQDRVLIALEHSADSAVCILAAITVGAIAVPLTSNLSSAQYATRVVDSQAKIAIVDKNTAQSFMSALDNQTLVKQIIGINTDDNRMMSLKSLLARQSTHFDLIKPHADTPAIMLYPEQESDQLKATIFTHQSLIGTLPGYVASQNWFPQEEDIFWSSYDWNSAYGLINALLPTLYFGKSIVGCPSGRTIPRLFTLLEHYQISNILTSGHELNRIKSYEDPLDTFDIVIRNITCPEDEISPELLSWAKKRFNVDLNGIYSPLGFAYIIGDCSARWPTIEGSMGRVYPGHAYSILNEQANPVKKGEIGQLMIHGEDINNVTDPTLARYYWQNGQLHTLEPANNRFNTDLQVYEDENGYLWRS